MALRLDPKLHYEMYIILDMKDIWNEKSVVAKEVVHCNLRKYMQIDTTLAKSVNIFMNLSELQKIKQTTIDIDVLPYVNVVIVLLFLCYCFIILIGKARK